MEIGRKEEAQKSHHTFYHSIMVDLEQSVELLMVSPKIYFKLNRGGLYEMGVVVVK